MRRSNKLFIFFFVAGIFVLSGWWVKTKFDIVNLEKKLNQARAEIQRMEAENEELQDIITEKINDPFFREKLARENFGLAKKGDVVYRIVPLE